MMLPALTQKTGQQLVDACLARFEARLSPNEVVLVHLYSVVLTGPLLSCPTIHLRRWVELTRHLEVPALLAVDLPAPGLDPCPSRLTEVFQIRQPQDLQEAGPQGTWAALPV